MNGQSPGGLTINDVHAMLSKDIGSRYPSKGGLLPNRIKHSSSDGLLVCQGGSTAEWMSTSTDGKRLTCDDSQSNGLTFTYEDQVTGEMRAAGSTLHGCSFPPFQPCTSSALVDARNYLTAVYIPYACTITGVSWCETVQGNFTGDNENSFSLYTSDGTTLTEAASSANDANIFKAATGVQATPFATPYSASAGVYWVGTLYNNSATVTDPSWAVISPSAQQNARLPTNVVMCGYVAGKSVQASTYAWSSVTASSVTPWVGLY